LKDIPGNMEVSHMTTTRPSLGKYLVGMAACLIIFLAGGWLILAPFALGYQPYGAAWVSQTTNDFVVGICVAVVALIAFALFFASLLGSLRAAGMISVPAKGVAQATTPDQVQASVSPASASTHSELDQTLSALAKALANDLNARRQVGSDQVNNQPVEQSVTRRES
jgi:hypothetical protein